MPKYNIVYLTTYIDEEIEKILNLPYSSAGLKKKNQLLDILINHNIKIVFVSSFMRLFKPITTPFYKKIRKNIILIVPFFIKIPILNYIINPIFVFFALQKIHKKSPIDFIILYNCTYENVIPTYFINRIYKVKVICQYEDGLIFTYNSKIKNILYKFSHKLAYKISSGIITNSYNLLKIFKKQNFFIFRGNIENKKLNLYKKHINKKFLNIVLSSSIDNIRGIELLIKLFNEEKDPDFLKKFNFIITGKGDKDLERKLISSIDHYIDKGGMARFYGYVSNAKLQELYKNADVLLALQKPNIKFSEFCFPSKIFEYYQCNKPIITTKISDLDNKEFFNLEFIDYNIDNLKSVLNKIYNNYPKYYKNNISNSERLSELYSLEKNMKSINNLFIRIKNETYE